MEICHRGPLPSATPALFLSQQLCESAKHRRHRSAWVRQADFPKVEPNNENHSDNSQCLSAYKHEKRWSPKARIFSGGNGSLKRKGCHIRRYPRMLTRSCWPKAISWYCYVPVKSKLQHPPRHTPGIWGLFLNLVPRAFPFEIGREGIWSTLIGGGEFDR